MPVNCSASTYGLLHGGATVALAESVVVPHRCFCKFRCEWSTRIEIAANHLKAKRDGIVTATAKIVHKGRSIHLWKLELPMKETTWFHCKLTNMILPKGKAKINNGITCSESKKTLAGRTPFVLVLQTQYCWGCFFSAGCFTFQVDDFTEKDLLFRLLMENTFWFLKMNLKLCEFLRK
jgi:uncharacterized protein (TIGR00369 family)